MTIQEIIKQLRSLGDQLESGEISNDQLIDMTSLSHDLYERMVILRHKAYEEIVNAEEEVIPEEPLEEVAEVEPEEVITEEAMAEEEEIENEVREPAADEEERPTIPIGNAEISPNQISLIDSIEEIKQMEQSINDKFKNGADEKSLAQTLQQIPLEDLMSSIGINQKFRFISQLFNEDQSAFESSINRLNSFNSYIEADEYLQNTLSEQYGWDLKDSAVKELVDLTQRRYL